MLFNSYTFIFLFLPVTLFVFFRIGGLGHHRVAIAWLVAASLFFYAWWNPAYLGLILASILFNYSVGATLGNSDHQGYVRTRLILIAGITVNLCLLGYFKYANFFIDNINALSGSNIHLDKIILPLAISFFTFQQITYLVDAYRGQAREYNFLHYCLFVTFFPQLIAGPIVHHREMLPQFVKDSIYRFSTGHFSVGLTIFCLGLFKKVVIADGVSVYATPVFDAAAIGASISFFEAWAGAFAYTFQLYFDFSGYSDMAIGLARMFGIRLPLNFHSPYKAINIIDFWRRWHMTLSRFLRDYVYIPLGGNRKGKYRRYTNLMITMLLGGLWHGAGWTFVFWGAFHGLYLVINNAWHAFRRALGHDLSRSSWWGRAIARTITLFAVIVAWVFFRAESFDAAYSLLKAMFTFTDLDMSAQQLSGIDLLGINTTLDLIGLSLSVQYLSALIFGSLLGIVLFAPNTQELLVNYNPALCFHRDNVHEPHRMQWKPNRLWATGISVMALWAILGLTSVSEFLYFQF